MRTTSFWLEDCPRPPDLPVASHLPDAADVAIVGGGYTGLSAAATLAEAGASVAVLERHEIGWGASSRNAGMALVGFQRDMPAVFARFGHALGRQLWQASVEAVALVDTIHREEGLRLEATGELQLAAKPSHAEGLAREADWFHETLQHPIRVLGRTDLPSEIGSDAYFGGSVDASGRAVQPARFVHALASRAARKGARLVEGAPVDRLAREGDGHVLHTPRGMLRAREVLIATAGYTDRLVPALRRRSIPIGSYIIVTEPLPADVAQRVSPNRRVMYETLHFLHYFRVLPDGRLLWGGRNNLTPDLDLAASAASLRRSMLKVFPYLERFAITHSWTGTVDVSSDRMPHLGERDGVRYAVGYGGHGVAMSVYLGREAALRMSGARARSPFEDLPHPAIPLYWNRPWFLPLVAAYYRFRDLVS